MVMKSWGGEENSKPAAKPPVHKKKWLWGSSVDDSSED